MMFVPLHRQVPDPGYSNVFYLNIDQSLSITRSADDTHTRIRGTSVITPPGAPDQSVIEVLVLETPETIAALLNSARSGQRMVLQA